MKWHQVVILQLFLQPALHVIVVAVSGPPVLPIVALAARLNGHKGGETLDIESVRRENVRRPVHLDELDLLWPILSRELVDNFVPGVLELHAVIALGHVEVDHDELFIASFIENLLQV